MERYPFIIFIDTCAFDPWQASEKDAISELLKLNDEGKINLIISYRANEELSKAPHRIAKLRNGRIYSVPVTLTDDEQKTKREIRKLLFPAKQELKSNERNDVDSIFEAQKYGARYFITLDEKHILSNIDQIEKRFQMKAVTPLVCLKAIKEWIAQYGKILYEEQ